MIYSVTMPFVNRRTSPRSKAAKFVVHTFVTSAILAIETPRRFRAAFNARQNASGERIVVSSARSGGTSGARALSRVEGINLESTLRHEPQQLCCHVFCDGAYRSDLLAETIRRRNFYTSCFVLIRCVAANASLSVRRTALRGK